MVLILAACGDPAGSASKPKSIPKDWDDVVACAKDEGSVVLYGVNDPKLYDLTNKKMQEQYGIEVKHVRDSPAPLRQKLNAEEKTGRHTADVYNDISWEVMDGYAKKGRLGELVGPNLAPDAFPKDLMIDRRYYVQVGLPFGFVWNTKLAPNGFEDVEDLLKAGKGRIGILEPVPGDPVRFQFLEWVRENYGEDYFERLAALEPRVYPNDLTMQEGVASGEVTASIGNAVQSALNNAKTTGSPISAKVDMGTGKSKPTAAIILAAAFADGPHPCAAQVLADFLASPEGQEIYAQNAVAAIPDVPGATMTLTEVQSSRDLSTKYLQEWMVDYREKFDRRFR